ncbi:MAG: InlB B-repeat-containing protein [Ruminococcus sp.]
MKQHIRQTALVLLTVVLLVAGAAVTMIIGYAEEYYTVRINYLFENGEKAHDPYIAVFEKNDSDSPVIMDSTVNNPIIQGYKAVDSPDPDIQKSAPTTKLQGELTENREYTIYYVPNLVRYKVKYFLQNAYDDDFTETLTLPESYYSKMGYTGQFPDELNNLDEDENFQGFTELSHRPDFIAADGSTEFEIYLSRNYYLINFDLNGGFGVDSVYAKYNTPFTTAKPQKEGYLFAGWAPCNKNGNFIDENGEEITEEQRIHLKKPKTAAQLSRTAIFQKMKSRYPGMCSGTP